MMKTSSTLAIVLVLTSLALASPVPPPPPRVQESRHISSGQAYQQAETILNRYFHLAKSDNDHLVHGMLHVLVNNPRSFPYVPFRALDIAFKSVEQKLGRDDVDKLTKPILLALEEQYRQAAIQSSTSSPPFKLTAEAKEKIEEALDNFLDHEQYDLHL